jgi:hypothetical protein
MAINLFLSATWLDSSANIGYGRLPLPQLRDDEITRLLEDWLLLDPSERLASSAQVSEKQKDTLLAYSARMASLAVREKSAERIHLGLLALGIDGWKFDWRDSVGIVCLHYDAALKLGLVPERAFEDAAAVLSLKVATELRAFPKRSPVDRSLAAMGYVESVDSDGFRYKRTW